MKSEKTEKVNKSVVKSPSKSQRKIRPEEPVVIARRCVVTGCKSDARPNSVYCSDTCIVSHARESLLAMSKEKTKDAAQQEQQQPVTPTTPTGASKWKESVEFGQLMSQPTPPLPSKSKSINTQLRKSISTEMYTKPANLADDTPVPVLEKSTGKVLSGPSAPKVANLEQWLKDNASFEVIKPNTLPKPKPAGQVVPSRPTKPPARADPTAKPKTPIIRKRTSIETSKDEESSKKSAQPDPESTRASAKSSLKDALWNRCKEASDLSMEESTVEQVASDVEEALYRVFNKDVGVKYKAKYRSLIFNIKDPKNLGLFRKIIEKQITPGKVHYLLPSSGQ